MRIAPISTTNFSYTRNVTNSRRKNITPSFGERSGHDFFVQDVGFNMLRDNPETFWKNIKPTLEQADVAIYFKEAVKLKMEESDKPDLTEKMEEAERKYYQASCLESASSDVIDYETGKKLAELSDKAKETAGKEYIDLKQQNRNNKKIVAYTKIANKLLRHKSFDPNYADGKESLIESVIRYGDDKLAMAIIRHKKFKKPEKFIYYSTERKFKELALDAEPWWKII